MSFQQYNQYPWLSPVRLVSVANIAGTYYNGPLNNGVDATLTIAASSLTVDSVVTVVGDRLLLAAQSATNQNGIYVVLSIGATVVLQRAADLQCIEQFLLGSYVSVSAGTAHAGASYTFVEPKPAQFGISAIAVNATITSGLGTSAAKAVSNNSLSTVASTAGSGFTIGNFTTAADTLGTIQDSGYNVNNVLLYASVPITAAQFNGMYAAPMLLVAAPGANNMIIVDQMELVMTFVSADYAAGGVVAAQYGATVHGAGVLATNSEAAADFFAAASTVFKFNGGVVLAPFSTCANAGLYLSNATQAFTTGDSTFVAKIHYRIIATA